MHPVIGDLFEARTGKDGRRDRSWLLVGSRPSRLDSAIPRSRSATARDPPPYFPERLRSPTGLFSIRPLMLPGLITYGLLASPQNGGGAIPCLWRLWFGFRCLGCGLSRANALLVEGSMGDALAMNWLILPLWLVAAWSFVTSLLTIFGKAHHHG